VGLIEIILLAVGLAMDAFAVSVTTGMTIHRLQVQGGTHSRATEIFQAMVVALCFGFFQGAMPLAGWYSGTMARAWIEPVDHWVAFSLLFIIGAHMIWEARADDDAAQSDAKLVNPMRPGVLLTLAIATSIDAFAAGISIAALGVAIIQPVLIIAVITALLSFIGTWIGDMAGHLFEKKLEIIGGVILILIGVKVLVDHMGG